LLEQREPEPTFSIKPLSAFQRLAAPKQLRQLEADGAARRIVHRQVPPKVEYGLTAWGHALFPGLDSLLRWAASRPGSD
jgi:HxlR-like helix-turn-helix protein